jgi:alpha-D-ribose 1-methylphosphonate 5-triphosphate synthase subunit PhnH
MCHLFTAGENSHSSLLQRTALVSGPDCKVLANSGDLLLQPVPGPSSLNSGKQSPLLQSAPGINNNRPLASDLPGQTKATQIAKTRLEPHRGMDMKMTDY